MNVTPWSFTDFSRATAGPGNRRFAMLVAYFDESGTNGEGSRVTTVAGLLGDSIDWARLELQWKKRMAKDGVSCFHATDVKAGDDPQSLKLYGDAADMIGGMGSDLMGIGFSVYQDDWDYGASASIKKQCRTPYHFCLMHVLLMIHEVSEKRANSAPVSFVFAQQQQYQQYAMAVHEVFGSIDRFKTIGHLGFAKPHCVTPLQSADLYAHETYLELIAQQYGEERLPVRRPLRSIITGIEERNVVATIEQLHASADQIDELDAKFTSRGIPIPPFA